MRNKKITKKIAAMGIASCLALTILVSPITSMPVKAAAPSNEENVNVPYHTIIAWRFKEENGSIYRRLYNYTLNIWVGEWEYVCPA